MAHNRGASPTPPCYGTAMKSDIDHLPPHKQREIEHVVRVAETLYTEHLAKREATGRWA